MMRLSRPFTNCGDSSVDSCWASPSLVDRHHVRDLVLPQQLVDAEAQHVPVHGRHPVQRPAHRVGRDERVDPLLMPGHALHELYRVLPEPRIRVLRGQLLHPGDPVGEHGRRTHAAQISLVEDLHRAPACLVASCHSSVSDPSSPHVLLESGPAQLLIRPRYLPSRVSTLTFSPVEMNSGTWISAPVSTVAGLVP